MTKKLTIPSHPFVKTGDMNPRKKKNNTKNQLITGTTLGELEQLVDPILDLFELLLEAGLVDDGRIALDLAQRVIELGQPVAVLVDRVLHQVVAGRTVQAAVLPVVLVLLAAVARSALDVRQTLPRDELLFSPGCRRNVGKF